jgi:hypothetical protein
MFNVIPTNANNLQRINISILNIVTIADLRTCRLVYLSTISRRL